MTVDKYIKGSGTYTVIRKTIPTSQLNFTGLLGTALNNVNSSWYSALTVTDVKILIRVFFS